MSKLRVIDAKRMEKLLLVLVLRKFAREEVMCFTSILMEELQLSRIIGEEFWPVL